MTPQKIIIYTRTVQVHFHIELARRLSGEFPAAKVLFVSFFSHAVEIAQAAGFEAVHFPKAMQGVGASPISEKRIAEIDIFCRKQYTGLNRMLQMERFLPAGREAVQDFMLRHLTVLDELVEANTLSISSMYDHFFYVAAGMLAFEKGGAHFAFVGCGVPAGRVVGLRTPWETWVNQASTENAAGMLTQTANEVKLPPEERIEYMKKAPTRGEMVGLKYRVMIARKLAAFRKMDNDSGSYFVDGKRHWLWNALHWRFDAWLSRQASDPWDIHMSNELGKITTPTVYLALHMEPEATILMYSPKWRDQLEICRLVAEALPTGFLLLVKEHPRMLGKRAKGYYDAIKRFPNVRLVSTKVSSPDLIDKSVAVVSLAGNVTLEARLRGKPAYCFGRPPFSRMATACGEVALQELTSLDQCTPLEVSSEDSGWERWVHGTFYGQGGRSLFKDDIGQMAWDDSPGNVEAHSNFILGSLRASK
ncbi:MAG TPA: hypothetical protein DCX06_03790 [Opitutae bacterium]|nr:hypothetical protein [Opitutae bacterium]